MRLIVELIVLTALFALFTWFFAVEHLNDRISWYYWLFFELSGLCIYGMLISACVRYDELRYFGEDD